MICGKVILRKMVKPFAPMSAAASSSSVPCDSSTGMSSREMNGNVTNIVASTMPGTANTILISQSCNSGKIGLWRPNVSKKMRPAIIGETVTGKSISVAKIFLPLNLNLVMDHAAHRPKTVLMTTAKNVASNVKRIALTV